MLAIETRIRIRNILFATDFSPAASTAVPYAIRLAHLFGAKLWALHISPPAINPMTDPNTWAGLQESADKKKVEQRRALLETFPGLAPEISIVEGDLRTNFLATISENKIDLVVMGTHGRTGVSKFLLGSVAEEIFRTATCPILTVGPQIASEVRRSATISRILLATDFGPASETAAAHAVGLSWECKACLTVLHVEEELNASNFDHWAEIEASALRRLEDLVPVEAACGCVPDYLVERGAPAERILEVAARQASNLIVLGIRPSATPRGAATHLPFATAHKVVSRATCPVLTVRG